MDFTTTPCLPHQLGRNPAQKTDKYLSTIIRLEGGGGGGVFQWGFITVGLFLYKVRHLVVETFSWQDSYLDKCFYDLL